MEGISLPCSRIRRISKCLIYLHAAIGVGVCILYHALGLQTERMVTVLAFMVEIADLALGYGIGNLYQNMSDWEEADPKGRSERYGLLGLLQ